jgi:hypothetical protein
MEKRKVIIFIAVMCIVSFLGIASALDEEMTQEAQELSVPAEISQAPAAGEEDAEWLLGEVVNLDPQKRVIKVKYLDYESELEKEADIAVDDATVYENIKSIVELKQSDTVSVDYVVSASGKNMATKIILEKEEPVPSESETEIMPLEQEQEE